MEVMLVANIIQIRRDTAANWLSADPTLAQGELGIELDTLKFKVGDGLTLWSELGYIIDTGDYLVVTSSDGAALLPVGGDAERPSPSAGMLRFNLDSLSFEGFNGSDWGAIGGEVSFDDANNILAHQVFG